MFVLAERVEHLAGGDHHLVAARDDMLAEGTVRIVAVDQVEKIRRDREGQFLVGEEAAGFFRRGERHVALQLLDGRDPVLELPGPILPVRRRNVGPKALALKPDGTIFVEGHLCGRRGNRFDGAVKWMESGTTRAVLRQENGFLDH